MKALVKKANEDKKDVQLLIVSHNLAQRADGSGSPAEIFFKRHCRNAGLAVLPKQKDAIIQKQKVKREENRLYDKKRSDHLRDQFFASPWGT